MILCISLTQLNGQNWTPQVSNTNGDLLSIQFLNDSLGYAVGDKSETSTDYMRKTIDAGMNWTSIEISDDNIDITKLFFQTEIRGWIVGKQSGDSEGLLGYTGNGGNAWYLYGDIFPNEFYDIFWIGIDYGWFVGEDGTIYSTNDQGFNFNLVSSPTSEDLRGVYFTTPLTGVAVGDRGAIIHSNDGGFSWTMANSNTDEDLLSVSFGDDLNGWAVGDNGTIVSTTDGGLNWTEQTSGTSRRLFDVSAVSEINVRAVGQNGKIVHTMDGGQTWSDEDSGTDRDIHSIDMVSHELGWFCGDNGVIFIYDGTSPLTSSNVIQSEEIDLSVFPNPVAHSEEINIIISPPSSYRLLIRDIAGKVLKQFQLENSETFTLVSDDLNPGLYLIEITDSEGANFLSKKLMVF